MRATGIGSRMPRLWSERTHTMVLWYTLLTALAVAVAAIMGASCRVQAQTDDGINFALIGEQVVRHTGDDLSLVKLPKTQFKQVTFNTCRLMGVNWSAANWEKKSLLEFTHVSFKDCLLDHAIFIGLNLKSTTFTGCRAHSLDFEGANLTRANFHNADLEASRFVQCDLTEANFTGATNYQINASENTLHETRFSLPEAIALLHGLDIILED